ncbi:tetraacyldisaccharide 4'-kinase [Mucilaginibacter sabulilitoris]|uniref:Tetraacyldisaccharide 4'-kinase n=1 Tax=Mucilaginibacter sabulilitoris TaxID=1173583 RepID=A0ABZ0TPW7_9SPHI|nr:tetraacyldisaccharide 4'-kinase [Mucilaginibacter sabulilitoris]WPU95190.1 tetraacyldisaccharide 4'-kinase [Mucilaginibacter sabulilitoris]
MNYLRWLLFPFSLLYGLAVVIRNWFYNAGIYQSREFDLPVIAVGNLDVGGAGKSPMTEYLIRLLKGNYKLATLSRGYGRKTKGFLLANAKPTANEIGDEPAQFKNKFKNITVAVAEKRVEGIEQLQDNHDLIILDDAYQHRAVKPGFSILLFDYNRLAEPRLLLPAGNLREPYSGRKRANVIVVSKCPTGLDNHEQNAIKQRIDPLAQQYLFFTFISYSPLQAMDGTITDTVIDDDTIVFLLTGIANAGPLLAYLNKQTSRIVHHKYPDHHQFTLKNISKLADDFRACTSQKKLIITTEKDAQRLGEQELLQVVTKLPVLVLPIGIEFLNNQQQQFDNLVTEYVREYRKHRPVH